MRTQTASAPEASGGISMRRTKEESGQTREALLDAAFEVFYEKGFARTTLQEVAERAGCTRGALYWHFRDKGDLFLALAERVYASTEGTLDPLFSQPKASLEELAEGLLSYLRLLSRNATYRRFHELLYYRTEWTEELLPLKQRLRELLDLCLDAVAEDCRQLSARGILPVERDPRRTALALWSFLEGVVGLWLFDPDLFDLDREGLELLYPLVFRFCRPGGPEPFLP